MQKINYGLVISDFDGTLVGDNDTISQINKDAIEKYKANGGKFAISTGRLPNGIFHRVKELGLKGAISCCQGALIVDIETRKLLHHGAIPLKTGLKICKKMEDMGLHTHVYDIWDFYCNKQNENLALYERLTNTKGIFISDRTLTDVLEEKAFNPCKFLAMVDPDEADKVLEELRGEQFEDCVVVKSASFLVEVNSANYSKGTAVEFLADYYGVPIEKTLACGDQMNDISMIEKAGLGIAVKNADPVLKERADIVCDYTNNEGAVGKIIEKYGYTEA